MRVTIDDPEFDQAVRELAAATGEAEEVSLKLALRERLEGVTRRAEKEFLARVREATSRTAMLPTLDTRTADEIIGYNENGHFD